ncbi:hypothetical protein M422DRAFT_234263 [Sphaerobolus stellatus SS14]|uniref:Ran GTPase-activating protein 1 n=1 Tax=Sphaerobolus stellatus (strain SS14) TaxID=990650 RepID=A0A0C9UBT8_SPHS4|nr:hypothetical protein M422DRAFT_234263 [Sphaerobolus stellatus SS14]
MSIDSKIFSIKGKGLKLDTRDDIKPYLENLDASVIEEIHFGGNTLGVEAALELAEFLKKATRIKIADFADIFTGRLISEIPQALTAICDALKDRESLIEIDLSDNAFGGRSAEPMVPFLTHNRSLQILKLSNNGLGPSGGTIVADALLANANASIAKGKPSNLRVVYCGRNRLENGSAPRFAEAFAAHGKLVDVRMPQNGIRQAGIEALARGLAKCASMEHLDLQDNCTSDDSAEEGWEALAEALSVWRDLQTLNLSDCVLNNEGASKLFEVLSAGNHSKLSALHLQNDDLDESILETLAELVDEHLLDLKIVELQWNEVDPEDPRVQSIAGALKSRGGALRVEDEDEEEEKEEEEEEAEDIAEEKAAATKPEDEGVDELADAMANLGIAKKQT